MTPRRELVTLSPEQDAAAALDLFGKRDVNQLPVLKDGQLLGLIRREDILKWLSLHAGLTITEGGRPASRPLG
jgi:CBS domain-containing protein